LSGFSEILTGFQQIKTSEVRFHPLHPAFYTTALENPLLALAWKKIFPVPMFRGTCSSTEMLKGYMARESFGTPALDRLPSVSGAHVRA